MALAALNQTELEIDGFTFKLDTISEIGTTSTQGESARHPVTGELVKSGGDTTQDPIQCGAIYDDSTMGTIVAQWDAPSPNPWKDGSKKATLNYPNGGSWLLSGVRITSHKIPGRDSKSTGFGMLQFTIEHEGKRRL